jgi:replicative DNA helicase
VNSESALISAVCENKDIARVLTDIDDNMFVSHKDVWLGLKSYYYKYQAVPDVSVLTDRFTQFMPESTSGPTAYYIDRLREDYLGQGIRSILLDASKSIKESAPQAVLVNLQKEISSLSKHAHIVRDVDITNVDDAQDHYETLSARTNEMGGAPGIQTGFKSMDINYPTWFAPGHLAIMLGYSARGKTWLAGYFAIKAWEKGFKPMIVSMEMTPEAMRDRIYAMMGSGLFTMTDLQLGSIDIDDFRTWGNKTMGNKQNFVIASNDSVGDVTPETIQAKYDEHRPDIIIIDYMQLMGDGKGSRGETERVRNVSRDLKGLAVRNNVPIIAISAVTMTDVTAVDSPPMLEQVSNSKAIQYDADLALAVHKYDDTNIIEVVSRKNRHGKDFAFYLDVDLDRGIIKECFDAQIPT